MEARGNILGNTKPTSTNQLMLCMSLDLDNRFTMEVCYVTCEESLKFRPCVRLSQCKRLRSARLPVNHHGRKPMSGKPIEDRIVS